MNKHLMMMLNLAVFGTLMLGMAQVAVAGPELIGAPKCKSCHKAKTGDQWQIWLDSSHAKAFDTLASEEAKKIAVDQGLGDPQQAAACLKCHTTQGFLGSEVVASAKGKYAGRIRLDGAHGEKTSAEQGKLTFAGSLINGMAYEAQVLVSVAGGTIQTQGDMLAFSGCDSVTLTLAAETDYVMDYSKTWQGDHPHARVTQQVDRAASRAYPTLLAAHVEDYQRLYNRVAIDVGTTQGAQRALPTDQRLEAIGNGADDPDMDELLFQMGRYLRRD